MAEKIGLKNKPVLACSAKEEEAQGFVREAHYSILEQEDERHSAVVSNAVSHTDVRRLSWWTQL